MTPGSIRRSAGSRCRPGTEGGYDGPQVEQAFREMVEVGATWVQLIPTWYQETRNSSEIARTPQDR